MKKSILITTALLSLATTSMFAQHVTATTGATATTRFGHHGVMKRVSVTTTAPHGSAATIATSKGRVFLAKSVTAGTRGALCKAGTHVCYKLIGLSGAKAFDLNHSGVLTGSELAGLKLITATRGGSGFKATTASQAGVTRINLKTHMATVSGTTAKVTTMNVQKAWRVRAAPAPAHHNVVPAPTARTGGM